MPRRAGAGRGRRCRRCRGQLARGHRRGGVAPVSARPTTSRPSSSGSPGVQVTGETCRRNGQAECLTSALEQARVLVPELRRAVAVLATPKASAAPSGFNLKTPSKLEVTMFRHILFSSLFPADRPTPGGACQRGDVTPRLDAPPGRVFCLRRPRTRPRAGARREVRPPQQPEEAPQAQSWATALRAFRTADPLTAALPLSWRSSPQKPRFRAPTSERSADAPGELRQGHRCRAALFRYRGDPVRRRRMRRVWRAPLRTRRRD